MLEKLLSLRTLVNRRFYVQVGVVLFVLKASVEALLFALLAPGKWSAWFLVYLPLVSHRPALPQVLLVALFVWTLPFIWVATTMSMRRAVDAGHSPWVSLLLFVPAVNYLLMLWLAFQPSHPDPDWERTPTARANARRARSALWGVAAAVAVGGVGLGLSVYVAGVYAGALFLSTPFLLGTVSAAVYNREVSHTAGASVGVATLSLLVAFACAFFFLIEGLICLVMLFPLAWMATVLGALLGWSIARHGPAAPGRAGPTLGALLLPLALTADLAAPPPPLTETTTAVEIDASPEEVWERVVAFGRIEGEPDWFFRAGLAYPVEASIEGTGVGAVRRCSFSTGDFVEPITAWEFPHRLAFDVAEQPPPLHEWSPYGSLYTPHLDGYFRSVRGEFRLTPLPGGRTRLEGSTWYRIDMAPLVYWRPFAEGILHRIHARVLGQVKREAEAAPPMG